MYIFFDFDGTLADITERWWRLHLDVAAEFKLHCYPDRADYVSRKRGGIREKDIMKEISSNEEAIREYERERVRRIELPKYLRYDKLFPDCAATLRRLRQQGYTLVVVTKRQSKENFLEEFKRLGLSQYLSEVYAGEDVSKQELLRRHYGARALQQAYFVSDDLADWEIARQLNMRSVVAGYGCRTPEFLASFGAKPIINSLAEALSYVSG